MIEPGVEPCRYHRGEPADNCSCCRSERIANPAAEPDRWSSTAEMPRPRRTRHRLPAAVRRLTVVDAREDHR